MSLAKNAMQKCRAMTKPLYDTPKSVQETIPIYKIAEDGVFYWRIKIRMKISCLIKLICSWIPTTP